MMLLDGLAEAVKEATRPPRRRTRRRRTRVGLWQVTVQVAYVVFWVVVVALFLWPTQ
ncbi:hypothetical protein ACIBLA_25045 [Streptomyces sp. NPDC050433]|uniref:hypothetical protein n=1 Tax=unclassified Streptomyces TaxID=2593676 RepID=UPI00343966D6